GVECFLFLEAVAMALPLSDILKKNVREYIKHLACNKEDMFRIPLSKSNHD
ncbi:hypothetical protein HN873_036944, partial [Arachis hypogaea]